MLGRHIAKSKNEKEMENLPNIIERIIVLNLVNQCACKWSIDVTWQLQIELHELRAASCKHICHLAQRGSLIVSSNIL
jgi:hypothetical protein